MTVDSNGSFCRPVYGAGYILFEDIQPHRQKSFIQNQDNSSKEILRKA